MIIFFFVFLSLLPHNSLCVANLKYFQTLSHISVTSSIKRASDGTRDLMKRVKFKAFQRNFDITLKSGTHLMAEGFRARLVHEDGSSSDFNIDQSQIFSGHLTDKQEVRVHAHTEDTLWSIHIFDTDDIFAVEPAWRLLNHTENPKNDTMIAYRASDFSSHCFNSSTFCGVRDHEDTRTSPLHVKTRTTPSRTGHALYNSSNTQQGTKSRQKREEHHNAACVLHLVGDYLFYSKLCGRNHVSCANIMFQHVNTADEIFRASVFEDSFLENTHTDVGLLIGEMILYSAYTKPVDNYPYEHFNEEMEFTLTDKLKAFGVYASFLPKDKDLCINHLFTDYAFDNRALGLAYIGGICYTYARPGREQYNSGVTSGTDSATGQLSLLQMSLNFAHEIGHNFGSEHDPSTEECSRPANEGGHFLMWMYSQSGELPNNRKFSPCSLKHIGIQLTKSHCLISRTKGITFCGNGIVEQGEGCDAGAYGIIDTDMCCSNECMLRNNANCSAVNEGCCKNCSLSPAKTPCLQSNPTECKEASYCDGHSYKCPDPLNMADWISCRNNSGQCYQGKCRGFCEIKSITEGLNLTACLCETNDNNASCKWCCFNAKDKPGPCVVYSNETLPDGTPCFQGTCKAGVCESTTVTTIIRVYRFLPSPLNPSELVTFMRNNIVLTVTVLSLVLWLPPVYLISLADEREKKESQRQMMEALKQEQREMEALELNNKIHHEADIRRTSTELYGIRQKASSSDQTQSTDETVSSV